MAIKTYRRRANRRTHYQATSRNRWSGQAPLKPYRVRYLGTVNEVPSIQLPDHHIHRENNNVQFNNKRRHRNYMRGNDERIEPPVHILEGIEPRDFPRTKRAVDDYDMIQWVVLFIFYGWGYDENDPIDTFRNQWRGASCTYMKAE